MRIQTPSRLHITLIDLNGSYGRIDGGIGITLADPSFILEAVPADSGITLEFANNILDGPEKQGCISKVTAATERATARYAPENAYQLPV